MHLLLFGLVIIIFATPLVPAYSQTNSSPNISVLHQYRVNGYGFAMLNETVIYSNNSTNPVQLPTLQIGLPESIVSRATGFVNETDNQFSIASHRANQSTLFTISPSQPTLQSGSTVSVHLQTYLKDLVSHNVTSTGPQTFILVMTSPSLSIPVDSLRTLIQLPSSTTLRPGPADFSSGNVNSVPFYERTQKDFRPAVATTQTLQVQAGDLNSFQPIEVLRVARTLTASSDGLPFVSDQITVKNIGDVQINRLKLTLLPGDVTRATVLPSYHPPLMNPTELTIANGLLDLTKAPFKENIAAGDNFTFTLTYGLPAQFAKVSGNKVTVNVPYSLPLSGVVDHYTIAFSPSGNVISGVSPPVVLEDASPLLTGDITFEYTLSLGWAAQHAIPIGSLLFAIVFISLFVRRTRPVQTEEDVETVGGSLTDVIKAFEEKIALLGQAVGEMTSKGPGRMGKKYFDEIRGKLDGARGRALQRLNETRTKTGSKWLLEITSKIGEADREENRSSKDLVNLYEQYYTKRMRQETFEKLLPSYRRRLDEATNRLSDVLNAAQRESKQA